MIQPKRFLLILLALYLIGQWVLSGPQLSVTNTSAQVSPRLAVRLGGDSVEIPPLEPNKTLTTEYHIRRDSDIKVVMNSEIIVLGGYIGGTDNDVHLKITERGVILDRR